MNDDIREESDPGCADDEIEHYRQGMASLTAERDRLRALAFTLYRTLSDEPLDTLRWLSSEHRELLLDVVDQLGPHLDVHRAETAMAAVRAERDRLRAALDTLLDGVVGLDSDDAYVALTMEHFNVVRAALRKGNT